MYCYTKLFFDGVEKKIGRKVLLEGTNLYLTIINQITLLNWAVMGKSQILLEASFQVQVAVHWDQCQADQLVIVGVHYLAYYLFHLARYLMRWDSVQYLSHLFPRAVVLFDLEHYLLLGMWGCLESFPSVEVLLL